MAVVGDVLGLGSAWMSSHPHFITQQKALQKKLSIYIYEGRKLLYTESRISDSPHSTLLLHFAKSKEKNRIMMTMTNLHRDSRTSPYLRNLWDCQSVRYHWYHYNKQHSCSQSEKTFSVLGQPSYSKSERHPEYWRHFEPIWYKFMAINHGTSYIANQGCNCLLWAIQWYLHVRRRQHIASRLTHIIKGWIPPY